MGCIWSSTPSNRCLLCNCKQSRDSGFINNTCRQCLLAVQYRPSSTTQYYGTISKFVSTSIPNENRSYVRGVLPQPRPNTIKVNTSIPNENRSYVRGVLPQPRPNSTTDDPQFGKYHCKPCGRYWTSLRSWSTKYQMCKSCKNPVYPHMLRKLLSSDYTRTLEDSKEHERELCQMCKHLGYPCKNYGKNVYSRKLR